MKAVLQKVSENHKRQTNINSRHSAEKLPAASLFPSNDNHSIQHSPLCPCGGGCPRCRGVIQPKLAIDQPGDIYEQEADRVADQVMATSAHPAASSAPPRIQRFSEQSNGQMDATPASVDQALASLGRPLESALRQDMEQRFGHDFSGVRVHVGEHAAESAASLGASAYTFGQHVVFGRGWFDPVSGAGRRLIAHELAHTIQQRGPINEPLDRAPALDAATPKLTASGVRLSLSPDDEERRERKAGFKPPTSDKTDIFVPGTLHDFIHNEWTEAAFHAVFKRVGRTVDRDWFHTNAFQKKTYFDIQKIAGDLRIYDYFELATLTDKDKEFLIPLTLHREPRKSWKDDYGFSVHCPWLDAAKAAGPPPTRQWSMPAGPSDVPAPPPVRPARPATTNCADFVPHDMQAFIECKRGLDLQYAESVRQGAMTITEPIAAGLEAVNPLDPTNLAMGVGIGAVVKGGAKVARVLTKLPVKRTRLFEWVSRRSGSRGARYWIEGDAAQFAASQRGHHVYEYLDEEGRLLYVGKSGGVENARAWPQRLQEEHINAPWIGDARSVRVTHDLTEQEMWALEEVLAPTASGNIRAGEYSRKFPQGSLSENAASAVKQPTALFLIDTMPVRSSR